ncbi:aspartate kinase [Crocinitomicaceae bacterium CZZ-1]|uniref:Aspartokinase n=1 Tax=Taishania pollutisoli TaxID=2766479 RepID=A0A8J6PGG9_9FLAO|nr:aspartate kinase [Taishania pollutisoli]MBC9813918.1 aspartate kinase [Taishania pollutisoli]MBX2948841.1 aspartate kinase [Crocinitomicaceae bacterium]
MKILKFGGTSVGNSQRIKALTTIVDVTQRQIIVLSAVAGTTNSLVEISELLYRENREEAHRKTDELQSAYDRLVEELYETGKTLQKAKLLIHCHFDLIRSLSNDLFTPVEEKIILAQGELMSTALFQYYLEETGVQSILLPALEFMRLNEDNEPDIEYTRQHLSVLLETHRETHLFITQGYICRNAFGEVDNLRRGGSDYTASLIGAAIQAEEIHIWTDIDGMHNNDPRIVQNTRPIANLSFEEAAELAYFGAKILHPQSVFPAQKYTVPVRLLNTMQPQAKGTLISKNGDTSSSGIRAIAAKDGITAIRIQSSRMLLAYGFLRRVFEVFERYKTPIDMITTSEVAVSLTIDDTRFLEEIITELTGFGQVSVDADQTIICIVGTFNIDTKGYAAQIFEGIRHLPIRMISYGGSDHNISLLVHSAHKAEALQSLHLHLF